MRCNWGADYADPETWTDPFAADNNFNFMDKMLDSDFAETKAILEQYYAAVEEAKAETVDLAKRYELFAIAERYMIDNALVIPYNLSAASYQVTKLNIFEGEFAPFGISSLRFKYQTLYDDFVTAEQYEAAFAAWQSGIN